MELEKIENNIIIECPHCKKDNIIILENTNCSKCAKSFSGIKFKKTVASILMTGLFISSGIFGYNQYKKNSHRYPVIIEYAIIDQCVSGSGLVISKKNLSHKLQICIYSLEKSQETISYSEYSSEKTQFIKEFQKYAYEKSKNSQ